MTKEAEMSPWPNVRRSIFDMVGSSDDSSTKCFVRHAFFEGNPSALADQYKRAADQLVTFLEQGGDDAHPDALFMPIAYLYRHAIELKLKGLLEAMGKRPWYGHCIMKLWGIARPVLISEWPTADPTPLENTESLLKEFDQIDSSGQSLRYLETKAGEDTMDAFPEVIRLDILKDAVGEAYALLDGCSMHFNNVDR